MGAIKRIIGSRMIVVAFLCVLFGIVSTAMAGSAFDADTDNQVSAIAVQMDGQMLIGGDFMTVNGMQQLGIARLNIDGTLDTSFNFASLACSASSIVLQQDGKILIGGGYYIMTGPSTYFSGNIARLNNDGSMDINFSLPTLAANGYFSPEVYALALQTDGKILIGGSFKSVNGITHNAVARLNSDGTLDTSFGDSGALGTDSALAVWSVAVQADGKILVGGNFNGITGGASRNYIARLNSNGTLDTSFNSMADSYVHVIFLQSDGKMIVDADILNSGGTYDRVGCARLNTDGSLDSSFTCTINNGGGYIYSIAQQTDGKFVIGGAFGNISGTARDDIARLTSTGALDSFAPAISTPDSSSVNSVALQADGKVLLGGSFTTVNGVTHNNIARVDTAGNNDTSTTSIATPFVKTATAVSSTGFTANWYAVFGASGYRLDVATDSGFTNLVSGYNNVDVGNVTSYPVTGLNVSATYYYRVRAYNSSATSGNSYPAQVTTLSGGNYVKIYGTSQLYGNLQPAYNAASDSAIIEAEGMTFDENLTLNSMKSVAISGGYSDSTFTTRDGITTLQGVLTIQSGSLTVDLLAIK